MTYRKTKKLINKILTKEDCTEVGIFISILSFEYINFYGIKKEDFLKKFKKQFGDY